MSHINLLSVLHTWTCRFVIAWTVLTDDLYETMCLGCNVLISQSRFVWYEDFAGFVSACRQYCMGPVKLGTGMTVLSFLLEFCLALFKITNLQTPNRTNTI
ncbi:hypothetical protein F4678DRAFT_429167 [Xylaria arbuscula]|nr:hypothetical protein F4678DRAFT_429167 [Xylaria arbuscula]